MNIEQCTCYTHDSSTVVVIHEGDVPGGLFRLYLHANFPKVQWSILRSIPPQLLVRKQISRKCFSLGRHESLHPGQKYFPVFSRVRLPLKILFLLQKVQHFESAFTSICRPHQPCGAGMLILYRLNFAFEYFLFLLRSNINLEELVS